MPRFASHTRANLYGAFWMIFAMAAFTVEDAFFKQAASAFPLGLAMIFFGTLGASAFALWGRLSGQRVLHRDILSPVMLLRLVAELTGRLFFILAVVLTPLSSATVILQATPLVVVAGAAVLFGETVGPRRWGAILLGLIGVLVVVRPGGDSFTALSWLAVIGMLGLAGRDLASRAAPASLGLATLGVTGFVTVVLAGLVHLAWTRPPLSPLTAQAALPIAGATLAGVLAYAALMIAMRTGDVSAVTPMRYWRLLFGVLAGVIVFGEAITVDLLIGSALILASGVFILWRERRI